jgi:hypothetical protein
VTRIIRMLTAVTAAGGLALLGLMTAGAASAGTNPNGPGTYGAGSWFFDPGTGSNAIQVPTTLPPATSTSTVYQAQVQQPINPNGSSVWPAKKGVIPVQFNLQQATDTKTTTTTTPGVYPGLLDSENSGSPAYGTLSFTPPSGTTVAGISNLTAEFSWMAGTDHTGSMRWSIQTSAGTFYVYYGDNCPFCQTGTSGSDVNMTTMSDQRVETPETGPGQFVTWSDLIHGTNGVNASDASATVSEIDLVVDAGYAGTQQVNLTDVQITDNAGTSEYVPGTVPGSTSTSDSVGPWTSTTTPNMYIDVVKTSGNDQGTVDETTYTGVGDTGGQFSVVDSKYKYNLSSDGLSGAGTYNVYMDPSPAHSSPITNTLGTFILK